MDKNIFKEGVDMSEEAKNTEKAKEKQQQEKNAKDEIKEPKREAGQVEKAKGQESVLSAKKAKPAEGETVEKPKEGKPAAKKESEAKSGKMRPTNCLACNKAFKHRKWYYKDGNYFCTKRCWKKFAEEKKKEEAAKAAKKAEVQVAAKKAAAEKAATETKEKEALTESPQKPFEAKRGNDVSPETDKPDSHSQ